MGLVEKKNEIHQALQAACLDVDNLFDHEPDGLPPRISLTVSIIGDDVVTPEWWRIYLRVYLPGNLPAQPSQDRLAAVMDATDDVIPEGFVPGNWSSAWNADLGAHIAELVVSTPRTFED